MKQIIAILKSIKFWTILGVVASLIGLYYTFNDDMEKDALALSIGNYSIKPPKPDQEIVIVNIIYGFKETAPLLLPMPFCVSNICNTTVENVAMYYHMLKEWEHCNLINTSVKPNIELNNLYIIDESGLIKTFENDAGVFFPSITPKTSVGSVGNEDKTSNIFRPRLVPVIGENGYSIRRMPQFLLTIHGDDCVDVNYTIRLVDVYITNNNFEIIQKCCNEFLEAYEQNCSNMFIVYYQIADRKLYDIAEIPFFKMKTDITRVSLINKN